MRYAILIEYDGTNFCGWQRQRSTPFSVQQVIEEAIFKFTSEKINIFGAGRTDKGVHATGQVAHFELKKNWEVKNVICAINHHVRPHKISIISAITIDDDFHARFSATKRYYTYVIINRKSPLILDENRAWRVGEKLDIYKMKEAANLFIGKKDFTSFRASLCQAKSPIITLEQCRIEEKDGKILFHMEARSFLHHMVRNIVGTLYEIGVNKLNISDIDNIFAAKKRSFAGITAPATGLYLTKVDYQNYFYIMDWLNKHLYLRK